MQEKVCTLPRFRCAPCSGFCIAIYRYYSVFPGEDEHTNLRSSQLNQSRTDQLSVYLKSRSKVNTVGFQLHRLKGFKQLVVGLHFPLNKTYRWVKNLYFTIDAIAQLTLGNFKVIANLLNGAKLLHLCQNSEQDAWRYPLKSNVAHSQSG